MRCLRQGVPRQLRSIRVEYFRRPTGPWKRPSSFSCRWSDSTGASVRGSVLSSTVRCYPISSSVRSISSPWRSSMRMRLCCQLRVPASLLRYHEMLPCVSWLDMFTDMDSKATSAMARVSTSRPFGSRDLLANTGGRLSSNNLYRLRSCRLDGQNNRAMGNAGEEIAARWLTDHGFHVVARNLRTSYGELDVIAEKNGHVHVVEVKTRRGIGYGSPLEAIDHRKQEHLRRSTMAALAAGIPGLTRSIRGIHIDAMSILMSDTAMPCIEFLEDILA